MFLKTIRRTLRLTSTPLAVATLITTATLAALVFVPSATADLEIGMNPGSPLDWRLELPFHTPQGSRSPIYTHAVAGRKDAEEKVGHTGVAKPTLQTGMEPRIGSFNPLATARVLTHDIVNHLDWTTYTRRDKVPGELQYPPVIRSDLYWLVLAAHLRYQTHPNKISQAEVIQYLTTIGPPVRDVLARVGPIPDKPLMYLIDGIPELPKAPPAVKRIAGKIENPETKMLVAWACRELVSDHYYAYNPQFAKRTMSLGPDAIPLLIICSRSDHSLLRQNSTALLASYNAYDETVIARLRELIRSKDRVTVYRAMEGLIRWRDPEAEKFLLSALRSSDKYERIWAIHGLGEMHSREAQPLVRKLLLDRRKDQGELALTAIRAMAKLGDPDGSTIDALKRVQKLVRASPMSFHTAARYPPDTQDKKDDRVNIIAQEATIAMAYLDHGPSQKEVIGFSWTSKSLFDYNKIFALEALAACGKPGLKQLHSVVYTSTDMTVRSRALWHCGDYADAEFLEMVARADSMPSVLRVQAVRWLAARDDSREAALRVARKMVNDYLDKPRNAKGTETEFVPFYECQVAVQVLGEHEPLPAAALVRVIERALAAGHYEKAHMVDGVNENGPTFTLNYFPPLLESTIVELGRLGYDNSQWILENLARNVNGPARVEATLALGTSKSKRSADLLLTLLDDPDPWVRYAAYRSLKNISGREYFTNWLFGSSSDRRKTVNQWKQWRSDADEQLSE